MKVASRLPDKGSEADFVPEAECAGRFGLAGHRRVAFVRALGARHG
ncbi:MAG: hypothetical protein AAF602_19120 [Myxococcota bacterium]